MNPPGAGRHFLAEIHEQPAALLALLERLDEFTAVGRACAERPPSALRLVAHGSSDAAASYGVYAFGLRRRMSCRMSSARVRGAR